MERNSFSQIIQTFKGIYSFLSNKRIIFPHPLFTCQLPNPKVFEDFHQQYPLWKNLKEIGFQVPFSEENLLSLTHGNESSYVLRANTYYIFVQMLSMFSNPDPLVDQFQLKCLIIIQPFLVYESDEIMITCFQILLSQFTLEPYRSIINATTQILNFIFQLPELFKNVGQEYFVPFLFDILSQYDVMKHPFLHFPHIFPIMELITSIVNLNLIANSLLKYISNSFPFIDSYSNVIPPDTQAFPSFEKTSKLNFFFPPN